MNRLALIPLALALALPGCYATTGTTTVTSAEVDDGYEPAYYDGYVVYYDNVGRPYYYDRGTTVYVASSSPHYGPLVHHYRYYGPRYERWNTNYGYRYRTYRRAPAYHHYHR